MEITTLTKKSLVLKYEVYNPEEDKNISTSQKFSNIKTNASDEALKNVGAETCCFNKQYWSVHKKRKLYF